MVFSILVLLFVTMPILEIIVLFKIYNSIGGIETLALVVITGFVGATLARAQGFLVLAEIQNDLREGRVPAPRMMDGMMIIIAGVLLITPGIITDIAGFMLLIPIVRAEIRMWLKRRCEKMITEGQVTVWRW